MRRLCALVFSASVAALAFAENDSVDLARKELTHHLELAVGTASPAGWTFRFEKPADAATAGEFESHYRIDGRTVWFWGDDAGKGRWQRWGTLFAVELFAEKELGLRWPCPGDEGVQVRKVSLSELPQGRQASCSPALEMSRFRNYRRTVGKFESFAPKQLRTFKDADYGRVFRDCDLWLKRHRLQDRMRMGYGHAFTDWRKRFLSSHPEYLNLHAANGERGWIGTAPAEFVKLCTSNEAVVDQVIADWKARGCGKYLNVCENDGSFYCECENCRAKDVLLPGEKENRNHLADRYVDFWNRIAAKAVALRPDVTLIAYAYSDYRLAPRRTKVLYPDNMLFGFVPSIMDDAEQEFLKWREMGMKRFFLRPNYHCFWGTIPRGLERFIYDNFHSCLKLGMIGVDYDSNLGRYPMMLESYVTARMIADPDVPFETICADFYAGFGAAAPAARQYFEMVREDGEAARASFIARKSSGLRVRDDSELSCRQAYGRCEPRLRAELEVLQEAFDGFPADGAGRDRLRQLVAIAGHALATYRFLSAQVGDRAAFERRGRELIDFRTKHAALLPDEYGAVFGMWEGERRTWDKTGFYRAALDGGDIDPRGPEYGWRCSFERPGFPLNWRARDAFLCITNDFASAGRWSVKLMTDAGRDRLAIWQCDTPLAGGRYTWSADWRADAGVRCVKMRVVGMGDEKRGVKSRDLVNRDFGKLVPDEFKTFSVGFEVPPEFRKVIFYTSVGKGGPDKFVWLDNLRLARVESDSNDVSTGKVNH